MQRRRIRPPLGNTQSLKVSPRTQILGEHFRISITAFCFVLVSRSRAGHPCEIACSMLTFWNVTFSIIYRVLASCLTLNSFSPKC